ncbi:peptidoglycan recognition protein family protein [Notoacmeibacter ruber]|uniref:Peptidoglycan-binding domain-containing protein n=1 Tax=Notoacmeibacter ruber TaxID=2670375 RepID=A0A3L7JDN6_9HYPH|nr:N-acetylmuramoyl-L-alanine amidase [Notoacmeibacter ruber]RLQ88898.1 peptidoglycan-binding domain-containing protein [Notoacmeibacter ruber]
MRPIKEIILHCTATPEGRPVTVAEIDAWHRARGWSGIGYHRVVHLDGTVEDGRPIEKIGAHVAGHNTGTVGLVYVGGVTKDGVTPKDTRTNAQKASLEKDIIALRDRFDIKKISGHNEYAAKACPSFDASAEYDWLVDGRSQGFAPSTDPILNRGDRGPAVARWIEALAAWRRMIGHAWPPTGDVFDHTIETITIEFQKTRGIVADGKVGPQTEDEMARTLAGQAPYQAKPENNDEPDVAAAVAKMRAALADLRAA